jgi:diacylglycerol O-acyltransferase / wax synthase
MTRENRNMANPDRLTGLDAAFLDLEAEGAHMHVAGILIFDGEPPGYDDLLRTIESRLHLVPRYRQKLAYVPFGQGRPEWVDDPHFNLRYHVRHSALPAPGGDEELERIAGRLFALPLDRGKPLWELNLVEGLALGEPDGEPRFAIISKTHHALVDGVSGVDITSVLFEGAPEPEFEPPRAGDGAPAAPVWVPRPEPTAAQLLARALVERANVPGEGLRALHRATRAPRRAARRAIEGVAGIGAMARAGFNPAPGSPLNVPIGPHRRYTWVDADLDELRAVKNALGGTLNDAVLASVTLALGRWLRGRGEDTEGQQLKAMVPVSVRAETERGALGNRVAAMWAPLPVGLEDPRDVYATVSEAMRGVKDSGQAIGARALTQLADFAPPTIASQAARLQARQRYFNLVVTNVPGPQIPLYLLGRRMRAIYPVVPLARNQALGIAIMSYNGRLGYGLLADYDALPDLPDVAVALRAAIADLAAAAGVQPRPAAPRTRRRTARAALRSRAAGRTA